MTVMTLGKKKKKNHFKLQRLTRTWEKLSPAVGGVFLLRGQSARACGLPTVFWKRGFFRTWKDHCILFGMSARL